MKRTVIKWTGNVPGYGAAMPNGDYACLIPGSHIETSRGRVELPGEDVGFLDVDNFEGEFIIVGAGQKTDRALLYQGGKWRAIAHPAYGMDAAMFNPALGEAWVTTNGTTATCTTLSQPPKVRTVAADTGSQGFAFARPNGTMALGWQYYIDLARGLCVYTDFIDVAIGQGVNDGAVVRFADDGILRQFALGVLRNPRIKRAGENYAAVFVDYNRHETTFTWCVRAELRAMKPVGAVPPPPPPPPEPPPVPVTTPNMRAFIEQVAERYRALLTQNTTVTCGLFTEVAAFELHRADSDWGLLSKQPGENQFMGHAVDAIIYRKTQQVIDILSNAGAREEGENKDAGVTWIEQPKRHGNDWMQPFDPDRDPDAPPDAPPVPVSALIDTRKLEAALAALQASDVELRAKVAALEARPAGGLEFPLRVSLKTDSGNYLCAEGGGGGEVNATRESAGGWETFEIDRA
jgi:hypothetical protein